MALDDLAQLVDRDHEQVVLPRDCGRRPGNNPDVVDKVSGVMPGGGHGAKDAVLQAFAIPKTREEPQVCRLSAGGNRTRTFGTAEDAGLVADLYAHNASRRIPQKDQ